jgi:Carboxypeptidase regulatory-like domain
MTSAPSLERGLRLQVVLVLALAGVFAGVPVSAQIGGAANIAGVITDDSGGALPGVTVTITNTATGRAQTLVTNDEGRYRAVALQPGPYAVTAELQGFAIVRREITLVVGSEAALDLSLGVANLAETITVVGESPLVEVAKSQPSSVITAAQLEQLPVLSRNFLVLAQLLPGAAPISRAVSTLPRNGATKFGAVPDERYAYTTQIDGGDVDDAIWGHPTINLSQDAVAEFKVYRNQFDAQYGKATTAVVSVTSRSMRPMHLRRASRRSSRRGSAIPSGGPWCRTRCTTFRPMKGWWSIRRSSRLCPRATRSPRWRTGPSRRKCAGATSMRGSTTG